MSAVVERVQTVQQDNLPHGWRLATIVDLVGDDGVFVDGDWVESKDQDPVGNVRLIQLADIGDGQFRNKSARFLTHTKAIELGCTFLKKGDVLIARMPDPLGRACIFPGDSKPAVTVVDVAIVRSAAGEFDHHWLMYFVNAPTFRSVIASMQSGSTRKRISRGNLAKITLPVPPLDQQKHIVAEIEKQFSRLDEAVANLKRVKANLKRYKATVLKYTFESKYSEKWLKAKVGELFRVVGGGTPTTSNPEFWTGEYPWISSADIDDLYNITPRRRITQNAINSSATNLVPKGSIIVVTRVGLGKVAEAKEDLCFSQDCQGLLFDKNIINSKFAMLQLSRKVQLFKYISRGTTISGVTKKQLLELEFMLPPVEDQQKIAEQIERQLSITDEFETQVDVNMKRADRLRQSILNKAFSGGLGDSASNAFKAALVQQ